MVPGGQLLAIPARAGPLLRAHLVAPVPAPPPADDRKARDLIDTKNQADSMVYQTEKQLKEFADKVGATQG